MDPSCLAPLFTLARPALPVVLADRLARWGELSAEERERARGDLELLAAIMRPR